jgi:hypothetical protein
MRFLISTKLFQHFPKLLNSTLISLILFGGIFWLVSGPEHYSTNYHFVLYKRDYLVFFVIVSFIIALYTGGVSNKSKILLRRLDLLLISSALFSVFFLLVPKFTSRYSYFWNSFFIGEFFLFFILLYIIYQEKEFNLLKSGKPIVIATSVIFTVGFLANSKLNLITSDDHLSFYFRLEELKRTFPNIPFYYVGWNGGIESRDFFATGALSFFILFSPIIYLFDLSKTYTFLLAILLFILLPISYYISARILNFPRRVCYWCGFFSLVFSRSFLIWSISFGTLGFLTSIAIFPLLFALTVKFLKDPTNFNSKDVVLFTISATLYLLWPLAGITFLPFIVLLCWKIKDIYRVKNFWFCFFLVFLINSPWILVFFEASDVLNFITTGKKAPGVNGFNSISQVYKHKFTYPNLAQIIKNWRNSVILANPLLINYALLSFLLFKRFRSYFYLILIAWLSFVSLYVVSLKPHLELDRFFIFLSAILIFPTSYSFSILIRNLNFSFYKKPILKRLINIVIATPLVCSVLAVFSYVSGHGEVKPYFTDGGIGRLAKLIAYDKKGGRTLFSGSVLHELEGGHFAALTFFVNKPLIASSPMHTLWVYTDIIPPRFRDKGLLGVENFMDLFNVSSIIAHEKKWKNFLEKYSDVFLPIGSTDGFYLFKRKNFKNSYFLHGKGEIIEQGVNELKVKLLSTSSVIKFNFHPQLLIFNQNYEKLSNCIISNFKVDETINFIKLTECPKNQPLTLKLKNPITRLIDKVF